MVERNIVMRIARLLLYAHCLTTIKCVGVTTLVLSYWATLDGEFSLQMEAFFAHAAVALTYDVCMVSCAAFPVAVALTAVNRVPAWRWAVAVAADVILGMIQWYALFNVYPVRE